jgi:hypothetical protein
LYSFSIFGGKQNKYETQHRGKMKNVRRNVQLVNLKGRENLGDTVVDGRKIKADLR